MRSGFRGEHPSPSQVPRGCAGDADRYLRRMSPRILFVCLGNICRSPAADAALREALPGAQVDSAGTSDWNVGDPPNPRMVAAGRRAGLEITGTARQVTPADFDTFDLIVAMDRRNLADLLEMRPPGSRAEVRLFGREPIPDPYHRPDAAFDEVVSMVREAAASLAGELN